MGDIAQVAKIPKCDFSILSIEGCESTPHDALYDGKTIYGSWGYMCQAAFDRLGMGLGTGKGQKLVLATLEGESR